MTEQIQAIQRESNKLGLKRILDLALVPSSIIRVVAQIHRQREIESASDKEIKPLNTAMKALGYISATGGELMRLILYYDLAEFLYKTINLQT